MSYVEASSIPAGAVAFTNSGKSAVTAVIGLRGQKGDQGEPGPGFDGNDTTYNEGQGPILTWPDGSQARIITLFDDVGNKTIDFEEVP